MTLSYCIRHVEFIIFTKNVFASFGVCAACEAGPLRTKPITPSATDFEVFLAESPLGISSQEKNLAGLST